MEKVTQNRELGTRDIGRRKGKILRESMGVV